MTAAWAAIGLCVFGWLAVRWAEETERVDNICALIMSVDIDHDGRTGS